MVFSSLLFLYAFFPASLLVYKLCRTRDAKNTSLLVFSLIFYAWGEPKYVLLLIAMSFVDWFCALRVSSSEKHTAKVWLSAAVIVDLALIGFFKYAGFLCSLFGDVPKFISEIALPIGISFYTFQLLTYVIDVYRGEAEVQKNFFNVLLYAALFHQCVAGPIVRYKTISEELFSARQAEPLFGIKRFSLGLAKKTLLANPCGELADSILLAPAAASDPAAFAENLSALGSLPVLSVWIGVAAFMLQIYLDFSAYSDMAIGLGKMLGFHYMENFNYPYVSRSVTEFWRRWHISLGTFFRDYVYIPLGGNRCSKIRHLFNLFVVWGLTGLWHGASWNFVFWGLYFFVFLVLEKYLVGKYLQKSRLVSHFYLLAVVFVGWILFHFTDVRLGWAVFKGLFGLNGNVPSDFFSSAILKNNVFLLLFSAVCCTPALRIIVSKINGFAASSRSAGFTAAWEIVENCMIPVLFLLLATCSLVGDSYNPFIYFQF